MYGTSLHHKASWKYERQEKKSLWSVEIHKSWYVDIFFKETIEIRPTDTESHIFPLLLELSHVETLLIVLFPERKLAI